MIGLLNALPALAQAGRRPDPGRSAPSCSPTPRSWCCTHPVVPGPGRARHHQRELRDPGPLLGRWSRTAHQISAGAVAGCVGIVWDPRARPDTVSHRARRRPLEPSRRLPGNYSGGRGRRRRTHRPEDLLLLDAGACAPPDRPAPTRRDLMPAGRSPADAPPPAPGQPRHPRLQGGYPRLSSLDAQDHPHHRLQGHCRPGRGLRRSPRACRSWARRADLDVGSSRRTMDGLRARNLRMGGPEGSGSARSRCGFRPAAPGRQALQWRRPLLANRTHPPGRWIPALDFRFRGRDRPGTAGSATIQLSVHGCLIRADGLAAQLEAGPTFPGRSLPGRIRSR